MANALMTATLQSNGNYRTPRGRLLYPSLFQKSLPKGETDPAKAAYQVTLLIPKGSDLSVIEKAINDEIEANVPVKIRATAKVKKPILKTADSKFADFAEDYPFYIRCNAKKMKPDVVTPKGDRNVAEAEEPDEVYSGRWGRLTCQVFYYDHPTGGKGVSLGLANVQLLLGPDGEPGEPMAGGKARGTSEFEAVGDDDLGDMAA